MAGTTSIEWTSTYHADGSVTKGWTANPIRFRNHETGGVGHYCEKIDDGCANCYAQVLQKRFQNKIRYNKADRDKGELFLEQSVLDRVRKRRKPVAIFWCDMTDLFGDWVELEWIRQVMEAIVATPQHRHMLLTKRIDRAQQMIRQAYRAGGLESDHYCGRCGRGGCVDVPCFPNLWLGCSVSDQRTAEQKLPDLLKCRQLASKLFVSAEPLLGPIDWVKWVGPLRELMACKKCGDEFSKGEANFYGRSPCCCSEGDPIGQVGGSGIDLVIFGGESGHKARQLDVDWIRSGNRQLFEAGVSIFNKQMGRYVIDRSAGSRASTERWPEAEFNDERVLLSEPKGNDMEKWPQDLRRREIPR